MTAAQARPAIGVEEMRDRLTGGAWDDAVERCAIPAADLDGLLGCREQVLDDPARLADTATYTAALRRDRGDLHPSGQENWATRFDPHDPQAAAIDRYFFVFALLAAVPDALEYHRSVGVDDARSRATFADFGLHLRVFRRTFDRGGLHVQSWFRLHFTGLLYDLGRLQFNRGTFDVDPDDARAARAPIEAGAFCLHAHIPAAGPLRPAEVAASFATAIPFFAEHFPDEPYPVATCGSWLLDPQLADYLPADSNIVRFGRLFTLVGVGRDGDEDMQNFVCRKPGSPIDALPQRSALERAAVEHWRRGRHWAVCTGWVALSDAAGRADPRP